MFRGQTQFRPSAWIKGFLIASSLLVFVLAFIEYDADETTWVFYSLLLLCIIFPIGVAAVFTDQIDLTESDIRVRHNFRRSEIRRANIDSVTWAKGVGVILAMKDGSSRVLPDIGLNAQSVCNSIRAWVKAGADRP